MKGKEENERQPRTRGSKLKGAVPEQAQQQKLSPAMACHFSPPAPYQAHRHCLFPSSSQGDKTRFSLFSSPFLTQRQTSRCRSRLSRTPARWRPSNKDT